MRPFLLALVWAAMIAVSTWPILLWLQRRFGGRRGPAVAVMVVVLLLFLVVPIYLAISTVVESCDRVVEAIKGGVDRPCRTSPGGSRRSRSWGRSSRPSGSSCRAGRPAS